jgi:hypothetical protein
MNWGDLLHYGRDFLPLLAACLVLLGVVVNTRGTTRTAKTIADDRLEHDRLIAAQGRLFEPRAKVYLDAMQALSGLGDIASGDVFNGEEYAPGWKEKFSHQVKQELTVRMRIYGTPDAVKLFESAWTQLWEATQGEETTHSLWKQIMAEEKGSVAQGAINETRKEVETEANRYAKEGYLAYEQFSLVCQRDLAAGKQDLPEIRS